MTNVQAGPLVPEPLINRDFADPDVLRVADGWHAYSTNSVYGGRLWHVPTQRATTLRGPWSEVGDAMPTLPGWVDPVTPNVWAPEISVHDDGRVLLYFTARHAALRVQCIGVAIAPSPSGPFTPVGGGPLILRSGDGDTLDAESFVDTDGSRYLIYKSGRVYSTMWVQRLAADGLSTVGDRIEAFRSDRPEEANIVEAPSLVRRVVDTSGHYVLFYSANTFFSGSYHVNYATAPSVTGPYTKAPGALLTTDTIGRTYLNPGHQDVVQDPEGDFLVFHASINQTARGMFLLGLGWTADGRPAILPVPPGATPPPSDGDLNRLA